MAERLSSPSTFTYKVLFPFGWSGVFGLVTLLSLLGPEPDVNVPFLVIWLVGSVILLLTLAGLKRVDLDGDSLIISNYIRKIVVPVSDIEGVWQNHMDRQRPITIQFRHSTVFGRRIVVMPKFAFRSSLKFSLWKPTEDEVVLRLRRMAGLR
jgi:hypothetical protein